MTDKEKVVVFTSGTWDMFHVGHLNILERSKQKGDVLIVGVSTDELIESYKGSKPVIPFKERIRLVQALRCVDQVVAQDSLMDIELLKRCDADIVTIGDDWKDKHLEGLEWMKSLPNKQVVYLEYTSGISTTGIKRHIIDNIYEIISAEFRREEHATETLRVKV